MARLCHDCEEVHEDPQCPVCASETFTFITRWVPAPERRKRPRPTTSPEAEVYRQLTGDENNRSAGHLLKRTAMGLTVLGLAGWFLGRRNPNRQPGDSLTSRLEEQLEDNRLQDTKQPR
jgi:hypothetical protein